MVIPKWEEMSKDEDGRESFRTTQGGTVILGLIHGTGMTLGIRAQEPLYPRPSGFLLRLS